MKPLKTVKNIILINLYEEKDASYLDLVLTEEVTHFLRVFATNKVHSLKVGSYIDEFFGACARSAEGSRIMDAKKREFVFKEVQLELDYASKFISKLAKYDLFKKQIDANSEDLKETINEITTLMSILNPNQKGPEVSSELIELIDTYSAVSDESQDKIKTDIFEQLSKKCIQLRGYINETSLDIATAMEKSAKDPNQTSVKGHTLAEKVKETGLNEFLNKYPEIIFKPDIEVEQCINELLESGFVETLSF